MAFQDRLNMNTRATVPQTPYTTERYEKEMSLILEASPEATDVNLAARVDHFMLYGTGEGSWFEKHFPGQEFSIDFNDDFNI